MHSIFFAWKSHNHILKYSFSQNAFTYFSRKILVTHLSVIPVLHMRNPGLSVASYLLEVM